MQVKDIAECAFCDTFDVREAIIGLENQSLLLFLQVLLYVTYSVCICIKKRCSERKNCVFIPRHTLVSGYYVKAFGVCPSVRPSVRPCSLFPIDNLSIYSRIFFKFCIHIVIGDEWYGIVNGQNPSIFNGVTALFRIRKMVSGLLFLYCS